MGSSKKIIAVCQSGGEFETGKDGSLTYHGGEAYALDLDQDSQLTELKQELAENYGCIVDDMLIKYFLPGNKKALITISKDRDLKRMVNFFNDSDQVEVFVMPNKNVVVAAAPPPPPLVNGSKLPSRRSSRKTVSKSAVIAAVSTSHTIDSTDMVMTNELEPEPLETVINETRAVCPGASINDDKHRKAAMQWDNIITGVGQRFSSFNEFRDSLHKYSIAHGFTYKYKTNDSQRISVKCKSEGCPWRIFASRVATTQLICIKTMNMSHTCEGEAAIKAGYRARGWVGSVIKEKLKVSPNYKPKDIVNDFKREYGIQLNYSQAWRAKEIAREQLQGSYKEAYSQLPFLCEKIIETNPGSLATFTTKEDSSFHHLFISFHASISGFQLGCRPLLFLDSVPLNSKYQGTLLAAAAADGDDRCFPVAFAVVDEETDENWRCFLMELKSAVATSREITFVADSQKGLRESLVEVFGGACYHGYCLRYLAEKLNKDLKGQFSHEARRLMVQDFYAAAYAPKVEAFQQCAENLKSISPEAYKWLISSEPEHWANAFFLGARYNHVTSNFGQVFYSWVSDANELPITEMIDVLRCKMMESIYVRRVESSEWVTRLTPTMEEKLKNEGLKARSFQVLLSRGSMFEVRSESVFEIVNIDDWDCTCKGWQLTGLPCCHAVAVLEWIGRDVYDYSSTYFTADSFRKTYAESIHPVPNIENSELLSADELPAITVTPPPTKHKRARGEGKMKKKQVAIGVDFNKRQLQCSQCKGLGHNKKTCNKVGNTEESESEETVTDKIGVAMQECS